jgi:hypothetical protein
MDSFVGSVSAYGFLFAFIVHFLEAKLRKAFNTSRIPARACYLTFHGYDRLRLVAVKP